GDLHPMPALQWFESPETNLAGTQAGLAMNYLVDPRRPLVVLSPGSPETKVSGRGTPWLVDQGLDLATALREAAAAVGGEGGGHKVASGATIPTAARETFLSDLNARVARQIPRLVGEVAA
ncbi:MAG TPA: DHHA1 domain-containing protein, partial [Thermoplasmata archaeon]|nr:DHHA1 domain-containing protein [Thermoplasmata archaeon]